MWHQSKYRPKKDFKTPSTLHYKVSMKCTTIKDMESFDPLDDAVPKFAY